MKKKNAIIALLIAAVLLTVGIALVACKSPAVIKIAKINLEVVEGFEIDLGLSVEGELKSNEVIKVDIVAGEQYITLKPKSDSKDYIVSGKKAGSPALIKINLNETELWVNVTVMTNPEVFAAQKAAKLADLDGYPANMESTSPHYAAFAGLKSTWKDEMSKADNLERLEALLNLAKGVLSSYNSSYLAFEEGKITEAQLQGQLALLENQTASYGDLIVNCNDAIVSLQDLINKLIGEGEYETVVSLSQAVSSLNSLTALHGAALEVIGENIGELEEAIMNLQDQIENLEEYISELQAEINTVKYNGVASFVANDYSYVYDGTQHDYVASVMANIEIAEAAYNIECTGLRFEVYNRTARAFEPISENDIVNAGVYSIKIIVEFENDGEGFALSTISIARATPGHPIWPTVDGIYSYYTRLGDVEFSGGSPGEGNASESDIVGYFEWFEGDRLIEPLNYGYYMALIPYDSENYETIYQLYFCDGTMFNIPMSEAYAVIVPYDEYKYYDGLKIDPYTVEYGIEVYSSKAHYDAVVNGDDDCTSDKDICLSLNYAEILDLLGRNADDNAEMLFKYVYEGLIKAVGEKNGEIDRARLFGFNPDTPNVGDHVVSTRYANNPTSLYNKDDEDIAKKQYSYHVLVNSLTSIYTIHTIYIAGVEGTISPKTYDESASVVVKNSPAFANVSVSDVVYARVVRPGEPIEEDFTDANGIKYVIMHGHTVADESTSLLFGIKGNYVDANVATANAHGDIINYGDKKEIKEVTQFSIERTTNFGIPAGRFETNDANLFDYFIVSGKITAKALVKLTGDVGEPNYKSYDATATALKNEITIGFNSANFEAVESGMYSADYSSWSITLSNGQYAAYPAINNLPGKDVYIENGIVQKKYAAFGTGEWELNFSGEPVKEYNYVYSPSPLGAEVPHGTASTVFFLGMIKQLVLDGTFYSSDLKATKQYDGNSIVYLSNFSAASSITLSSFTLTDYSFDRTIFEQDVISFVKPAVDQNTYELGVYLVNGIYEAKDVCLKNFTFQASRIGLSGDYQNYDWSNVTFKGDGEIIKRKLSLTSTLEFVERIYNAKADAYAVDFLGWLTSVSGHYSHTADYLYMDSTLVSIGNFVDGESAFIALLLNNFVIPDAKYDSKDVGNNKTISWEQIQWTFVTDNSHGLAEQIDRPANLNNYDWSEFVLTAKGSITKAIIDNISGITSIPREYDATAVAQVNNVITTNSGVYTGIAAGVIAFNGRYSDEHNVDDELFVKIINDGVFQNLKDNDAKNATINKQIFYYDYEILGKDAHNYESVVAAGYVQGTGDITRKTITAINGIVSWRTTEGYGQQYGNYTLPEARFNDITSITFVGVIDGDSLTLSLNSRGLILNYTGKVGIYETVFDISTIAITGSADTSVEDYDIKNILSITGVCFVYEPNAIPADCPTLDDYNTLKAVYEGFNLSFGGEEGDNNSNTITIGNGAEITKVGAQWTITLNLELSEGIDLTDIKTVSFGAVSGLAFSYENGVITIVVSDINAIQAFDMTISLYEISGLLCPPILIHVKMDFDLLP